MRIKNQNYWIISRNSNTDYWGQDVSPEWAAIGTFIWHDIEDRKGVGVEPHFHDVDEIWVFASGRGEAWIDGQSYEITLQCMNTIKSDRPRMTDTFLAKEPRRFATIVLSSGI